MLLHVAPNTPQTHRQHEFLKVGWKAGWQGQHSW